MIIITRTYTRPTKLVPWHTDQPYVSEIYTVEFNEHVKNTYKDSLIYLMNSTDDTQLILNFQSIWTNLTDYQTYLNDPICQAAWARRDLHNDSFGIISTPSVITEM